MEVIDSILSVSYLKLGVILIAFLLFVLWAYRVSQRIRHNYKLVQQRKAEQKRIQELRNHFQHDISTFVKSYRSDISTKLEKGKVENGLFVFWSGADNILKEFISDTSNINRLPNREERVAIRSFYTEAKSLVDGILYNNYLLKKYQYLRCKIKTTTATSAEIDEVGTITEQMSLLGTQLQQQHHELLSSLRAAKSYF